MNLSYGKHSLWTDSPCSMNFPNYVSTIERSRRFEFDSIYFRDDPCKPATDIDEFLMPDLILKRFRS